MTTIVRHTKFPLNPFGDGGARRSVQIQEHFERQGATIINETFALPKNSTFLQRIIWSLRAVVFITEYVGWKSYPSLSGMFNAIKYFALRIPVIYDKYKNQDVTFIWESTVDYNYGYVYLMKAAKARIIAYPHNLESLVYCQKDQQTGKTAPFWLYEEIKRLGLCDKVYCISKEETWLLQCFGLNAEYFPYYPPAVVEREALRIKESRKARRTDSSIHKFVLLGSATNPPTKVGMDEVLSYFESKELTYEIHVAGYGTECLIQTSNPMIIHHGTMAKDELDGLLVETDGIIINQRPSSGALTRIAEHRLAGVPVFASFGAARDYYNLDGIEVFNSMEELSNLLR